MSLRDEAREAKPHDDHWYPACRSGNLAPGEVHAVRFWNQDLAVFRGFDGVARVLEDRCAHRPVPLSMGAVEGCQLVCPYHGWKYDGDGALSAIPHSLCGKPLPKLRVRSHPVRERDGIIWFYGSESEAASPHQALVPPPAPLFDDDPAWIVTHWSARWDAHHSAVIDNVLDLMHAHLHQRFEPFIDPELVDLLVDETSVHAAYDARVGGHRWLRPLSSRLPLSRMVMSYVYPHHVSRVGDAVRHWLLLRPIDETSTEVFGAFGVHREHARLSMAPRWLTRVGLDLLRLAYIQPLVDEDRVVLEAEQRGHRRGTPSPELNPVVRACHRLTVLKAS